MISVEKRLPINDRRKPGCKNEPTRRLPIITLIKTRTKASLRPHHRRASNVIPLANPNRIQGSGIGIIVSKEYRIEAAPMRRLKFVSL